MRIRRQGFDEVTLKFDSIIIDAAIFFFFKSFEHKFGFSMSPIDYRENPDA